MWLLAAAILQRVEAGGPEALTRFARSIGDAATRLDRTEVALNANLSGQPRDTTTPRATVCKSRSVPWTRHTQKSAGDRRAVARQ